MVFEGNRGFAPECRVKSICVVDGFDEVADLSAGVFERMPSD